MFVFSIILCYDNVLSPAQLCSKSVSSLYCNVIFIPDFPVKLRCCMFLTGIDDHVTP